MSEPIDQAEGAAVEVAGGPIEPDEILCVRRGPGANCSSIGSAIDVLFATAAVAGAILVAVSAALADNKKPAPREDEEADDAGAG